MPARAIPQKEYLEYESDGNTADATNDDNNCSSSSRENAVKAKSKERVMETVAVLAKPCNPARSHGREFSLRDYAGERVDHAFAIVTRLNLRAACEWASVMGYGVTWGYLAYFVKHRGCVQIGPLFLSWSPLEASTFQRVFQVGHFDDALSISILRVPEDRTTAQDKAILRGLMKLYTSTTAGEHWCYISDDKYAANTLDSLSSSWLFDCSWEVTMDQIEIDSDDQPHINPSFFIWASQHFRQVKWIGCDSSIDIFLQHMLLDSEETVVEHLEFRRIKEDQVDHLASALVQPSKIESLEISSLHWSLLQVDTLVQAICGCKSLQRISFSSRRQLPFKKWILIVVMLIQCGHLESIACQFRGSSAHEFNDTPPAEIESLRCDQTNMILDAIRDSDRLRYLDLPTKVEGLEVTRFLDTAKICATLESRRDRLSVDKMSCMLGVYGSPMKLALFGKMITRLSTCTDKSKKARSAGMLFDLLCTTNNHIQQATPGSRASESNIVDRPQKKQKTN